MVPITAEQYRTVFVSIACLLLGFGLMMVYSASITSWPTEFERIHLSRQLLFVAVGVTLAGFAASCSAEFWEKSAPWIFWGTVLLLVCVMIPGVGLRVKGAQRWIRIAGFTLQPSEFMKIALPLLLARIAVRQGDNWQHWWRGTSPFVLPIAVTIPLVIVQPDLGTALFLLGGAVLMLLIGGWPWRNFFIVGFTIIPALAMLFVLKPYQQRRLVGFLETWTDWTTAPYQLKQSLVTLGTGGILGVGLGKGWQKLSFLPEANTDFVFAVVGEEFGLVGTISVVLLWSLLYLTGLQLLCQLPGKSFSFLAGFVLLTQLVAQAMLNVAVVTAMVPPKGISHPLISCGGSNLVVSLLSLGIFFSLTRADSVAALPVEAPVSERFAA